MKTTLSLALGLFGACSTGDNDSSSQERAECFAPEVGMSQQQFTEVLGEPINSSADEYNGVEAVTVSYPQGNVMFEDGEAIGWVLADDRLC